MVQQADFRQTRCRESRAGDPRCAEFALVSSAEAAAEPTIALPLPLTTFIGRELEITKLIDLLTKRRLISIVGPGGIGKTRLALEVARRWQTSAFTSYFVPLVAADRGETLLVAIAQSLGIFVRNPDDATKQIIAVLQEHPALLILDNFEQLVGFADVLTSILESVAEVRLLVTSRVRLNLYGETIYALSGLTFLKSSAPSDVAESEAVALFMDRARQTEAAFSPSPAQLTQIADLCQMLHGIPLAIEHAASLIHVIDPSTLLAEIQTNIDILHTTQHGVEARHQRMRVVIDYSWERLTKNEQHALMWLSVFRGGFTREAAAQVADATLDLLSALLAKSFVFRSGVDRYDLHELHRQYALEKLSEGGEAGPAEHSHGQFFEGLVRRICPQRWSPSYDVKALDDLELEFPNLRAAVLNALREHNTRIAFGIIGYGVFFFHDRWHWSECAAWAREALRDPSILDAELLTRTYQALALQTLMSAQERQVYLNWAKRTEHDELIAWAHTALGGQALITNALDEAQDHYEQAMRFYAKIDAETPASFIGLYDLGRVTEAKGDLKRALTYYTEAWRQVQRNGVHSALHPLSVARILVQMGNESRALALFQTTLNEAIYLGSPVWMYDAIFAVAGFLFEARQDFPTAIQLLAAYEMFTVRYPLGAADLQQLRQWINAAKEESKSNFFDAFWLKGKLLSPREALGLAQHALEQLD